MDILVYHGKHGKDYYVVDTPAQMEAAQRLLFEQLDEYHCYEDDDPDDVAAARAGKIKAIKHLLHLHRDGGYEYEGWDIMEAIDPCTP